MGQAPTARPTALGHETTTIGFAEPVLEHVTGSIEWIMAMRQVSKGWREAAGGAPGRAVARTGYASWLDPNISCILCTLMFLRQ